MSIRETLNLLENDYADYMSNRTIYGIVHWLLLRSDIPHQSFNKIGKLFDYAMKRKENDNDVITQIKELSFVIIGRDIFKREIEIIDGHNGSSYFWIMPVRVIDESDTNDTDNVAEMSSAEISIEEDDVAVYLKPFLYKHFDDELKANRQRADCFAEDNSVHGFEWYLTHNFYTHESMAAVLADIRDTVDALSSGRKNEFTEDLCRETVRNVYWQMYFRFPDEDELVKFQKNNSPEYQAEIDVLLDFYRRFLYRIEYMLKVGREKGYDLISVMGP